MKRFVTRNMRPKQRRNVPMFTRKSVAWTIRTSSLLDSRSFSPKRGVIMRRRNIALVTDTMSTASMSM